MRPYSPFLWRQHTLIDESLDFGVIARDLRDLAVTNAIDTTISSPDARVMGIINKQHRKRRPNNGASAFLADLLKFAVGLAHAVLTACQKAPGGALRLDRLQSGNDRGARELPASCPPMPSDTAHRPVSGKAMCASSFRARTLPR